MIDLLPIALRCAACIAASCASWCFVFWLVSHWRARQKETIRWSTVDQLNRVILDAFGIPKKGVHWFQITGSLNQAVQVEVKRWILKDEMDGIRKDVSDMSEEVFRQFTQKQVVVSVERYKVVPNEPGESAQSPSKE